MSLVHVYGPPDCDDARALEPDEELCELGAPFKERDDDRRVVIVVFHVSAELAPASCDWYCPACGEVAGGDGALPTGHA